MDRNNEDDDDCDGDEIEDGNDNDNDDDDVDCSTANSVDEGLHKTVSTRTPSGNKSNHSIIYLGCDYLFNVWHNDWFAQCQVSACTGQTTEYDFLSW